MYCKAFDNSPAKVRADCLASLDLLTSGADDANNGDRVSRSEGNGDPDRAVGASMPDDANEDDDDDDTVLLDARVCVGMAASELSPAISLCSLPNWTVG